MHNFIYIIKGIINFYNDLFFNLGIFTEEIINKAIFKKLKLRLIVAIILGQGLKRF